MVGSAQAECGDGCVERWISEPEEEEVSISEYPLYTFTGIEAQVCLELSSKAPYEHTCLYAIYVPYLAW